jgi:serine protease Do
MEAFGVVADQLRRSTVSILSKGQQGSGSGVVWDSSGLIVTNAHVVRGKDATVELWTGRRFPARLIAQDARRDLATLRMEADATLVPAALVDAKSLRSGELVIAVGNPLGFQGAVSKGVLHGVGAVRGLGPQQWVQASIRLAPGNSGGPLADAAGRVAGINSMVVNGGVGLAVPTEAVRRFVATGPDSLSLGVAVQPARMRIDGNAAVGLVVVDVTDGSPAAQASLMMGDVIIGVNGQALRSFDDLAKAIHSGAPTLTLRFLRGERTRYREVMVRLRAAEAA